jgi:hypothetical protein
MIDSPSAHLREESFILLRLLWIISYMEMIDFYFCSSQRRIFHFITPFMDPRGSIFFIWKGYILLLHALREDYFLYGNDRFYFCSYKRRIFHFITPFMDGVIFYLERIYSTFARLERRSFIL